MLARQIIDTALKCRMNLKIEAILHWPSHFVLDN
jgi:hypothetical protein